MYCFWHYTLFLNYFNNWSSTQECCQKVVTLTTTFRSCASMWLLLVPSAKCQYALLFFCFFSCNAQVKGWFYSTTVNQYQKREEPLCPCALKSKIKLYHESFNFIITHTLCWAFFVVRASLAWSEFVLEIKPETRYWPK